MQRVVAYQPDMVCVALAGNSVGSPEGRDAFKKKIDKFYRNLRSLLPKTIILATECEMRWYKPNNKWGAPLNKEYRQKSRNINTYLNRKVDEVDYVVQLGGQKGGLYNKYYFGEDGCHLKEQYQRDYWKQLKKTVDYVHQDMDIRVRNEHLDMRINITVQRN